ncbi:MAG: PHB depolymerase family esterase [Pseudomonadota bacterium]
MLKTLSKLWLSNAVRLAKAQAAGQRMLLKSATRSTKKSCVSEKKSSVSALLPTPAKQGRRKPVADVSSLNVGGKWTRSYYLPPSASPADPARRLAYWLYVPNQFVAGQDSFPLVVMLHGCEQTAADFASGTRMNVLAAHFGFAVLYPQQVVSGHAHRCWPWYQQSLQRGGAEVASVAGAIEKVVAQRGFDRSRIYIAGLSAGAALAQIVALRHPHLIAAVCSHSGPVYGAADSRMAAFSVMQHGTRDAVRPIDQLLSEQSDFPGMPMLILHGEQDTVVRPVNALQLAWQFCQANALSTSAHEPIASGVAGESCDRFRMTDYCRDQKIVVRLCQIRHLNHAWSGGDDTFRFNVGSGPDASLMCWEFFSQHVRVA